MKNKGNGGIPDKTNKGNSRETLIESTEDLTKEEVNKLCNEKRLNNKKKEYTIKYIIKKTKSTIWEKTNQELLATEEAKDRKSTRLSSSQEFVSRMPSSAWKKKQP